MCISPFFQMFLVICGLACTKSQSSSHRQENFGVKYVCISLTSYLVARTTCTSIHPSWHSKLPFHHNGLVQNLHYCHHCPICLSISWTTHGKDPEILKIFNFGQHLLPHHFLIKDHGHRLRDANPHTCCFTQGYKLPQYALQVNVWRGKQDQIICK